MQRILQEIMKKKYLEHQKLDRPFICPIVQATQHIILQIVGFLVLGSLAGADVNRACPSIRLSTAQLALVVVQYEPQICFLWKIKMKDNILLKLMPFEFLAAVNHVAVRQKDILLIFIFCKRS